MRNGWVGEGEKGRGNWGKYLHLPIQSERGAETERSSAIVSRISRAGGAGKGADLRKYFLDCKPNILKMKLIHLRHFVLLQNSFEILNYWTKIDILINYIRILVSNKTTKIFSVFKMNQNKLNKLSFQICMCETRWLQLGPSWEFRPRLPPAPGREDPLLR